MDYYTQDESINSGLADAFSTDNTTSDYSIPEPDYNANKQSKLAKRKQEKLNKLIPIEDIGGVDLTGSNNNNIVNNETDTDGRFGELIDSVQGSVMNQFAKISDGIIETADFFAGSNTANSARRHLNNITALFDSDVSSDELADYVGGKKGDDYSEVQNLIYKYGDLEKAKLATGVKQSTIDAYNREMQRSNEAFDRGDYLSAAGTAISNLPEILADSSGEMLGMVNPVTRGLVALGRANDYRDQYNKNNDQEMSKEKFLATLAGEFALLSGEKLLVNKGVKDAIKPFTKNIPKEVADKGIKAYTKKVGKGITTSALGEALQEYGEGVSEDIATQKEGSKTLAETLFNKDRAYDAFIGGTVGGTLKGMGVGVKATGDTINFVKDAKNVITPKKSNHNEFSNIVNKVVSDNENIHGVIPVTAEEQKDLYDSYVSTTDGTAPVLSASIRKEFLNTTYNKVIDLQKEYNQVKKDHDLDPKEKKTKLKQLKKDIKTFKKNYKTLKKGHHNEPVYTTDEGFILSTDIDPKYYPQNETKNNEDITQAEEVDLTETDISSIDNIDETVDLTEGNIDNIDTTEQNNEDVTQAEAVDLIETDINNIDNIGENVDLTIDNTDTTEQNNEDVVIKPNNTKEKLQTRFKEIIEAEDTNNLEPLTVGEKKYFEDIVLKGVKDLDKRKQEVINDPEMHPTEKEYILEREIPAQEEHFKTILTKINDLANRGQNSIQQKEKAVTDDLKKDFIGEIKEDKIRRNPAYQEHSKKLEDLKANDIITDIKKDGILPDETTRKAVVDSLIQKGAVLEEEGQKLVSKVENGTATDAEIQLADSIINEYLEVVDHLDTIDGDRTYHNKGFPPNQTGENTYKKAYNTALEYTNSVIENLPTKKSQDVLKEKLFGKKGSRGVLTYLKAIASTDSDKGKSIIKYDLKRFLDNQLEKSRKVKEAYENFNGENIITVNFNDGGKWVINPSKASQALTKSIIEEGRALVDVVNTFNNIASEKITPEAVKSKIINKTDSNNNNDNTISENTTPKKVEESVNNKEPTTDNNEDKTVYVNNNNNNNNNNGNGNKQKVLENNNYDLAYEYGLTNDTEPNQSKTKKEQIIELRKNKKNEKNESNDDDLAYEYGLTNNTEPNQSKTKKEQVIEKQNTKKRKVLTNSPLDPDYVLNDYADAKEDPYYEPEVVIEKTDKGMITDFAKEEKSEATAKFYMLTSNLFSTLEDTKILQNIKKKVINTKGDVGKLIQVISDIYNSDNVDQAAIREITNLLRQTANVNSHFSIKDTKQAVAFSNMFAERKGLNLFENKVKKYLLQNVQKIRTRNDFDLTIPDLSNSRAVKQGWQSVLNYFLDDAEREVADSKGYKKKKRVSEFKDEKLADVISYVSAKYLATRQLSDLASTRGVSDVARLAGIDKDMVDDEIMKAFSDVDAFTTRTANTLGKEILNNLGITKKRNNKFVNNEIIYDTLAAEVGLLALKGLEEAGVLSIKKKKLFSDNTNEVSYISFNSDNYKVNSRGTTFNIDKVTITKEDAKSYYDEEKLTTFKKRVQGVYLDQYDAVPDFDDIEMTGNTGKVGYEAADTTKDAVITQSAAAKYLNEGFAKGVKALLKNKKYLNLMGYKDLDGVIKVKQLSVKGKNNQILADLEHFSNLYQEVGSKLPFYSRWTLMTSGRFMIDSNQFNHQSKKLHRFAVDPDRKAEVTKSRKLELTFKIALAQAFDLDIDKQTVKRLFSKKNEENINKVLNELNNMIGNIEFKGSLEEFVKSEEFGNIIAKVAPDFIEKYGSSEPEHALRGVVEFIQYKYAKANNLSYSTGFRLEIDAKTSAIGIKAMQMSLTKRAINFLIKVGIFRKEDAVQNVGESIENKIQDSYEVLSNTLGYYINKEGHNAKMVLPIIKLIDPKASIKNNKITFSRSFSKNPVMIVNYGKGVDNLLNEIVNKEPLDNFYDILQEYHSKKTVDSRKQLFYYMRLISGGNSQKLNEMVNRLNKSSKDFELTDTEVRILQAAVFDIMGQSMQKSLRSLFSKSIKAQKAVNDISKMEYELAKEVLNIEIDRTYKQKVEEYGNERLVPPFTKKEMKEIYKKIEGVLPRIARPLVNEDGSLSYLYTGKMKRETANNVLGNVTTSPQIRYGSNNGVNTTSLEHLTIADGEAAAGVGSVHSFDSAIQAILLAKYGNEVLGVHDAEFVLLDKVEEVTQFYNKTFYELSKNYSLLYSSLESFAKTIKTVRDEYQQVFKKVGLDEIESAFDKIYSQFEESEAYRKDLFKDDLTIGHAYYQGLDENLKAVDTSYHAKGFEYKPKKLDPKLEEEILSLFKGKPNLQTGKMLNTDSDIKKSVKAAKKVSKNEKTSTDEEC